MVAFEGKVTDDDGAGLQLWHCHQLCLSVKLLYKQV